MKYFSNAQIEEIRARLATRSVRDSDFEQSEALEGDEFLAIVQGGINKKMPLADFVDEVGEKITIISPGDIVIHNTTGDDEHGVMSQRSITEELAKKMEVGDIVLYDETGDNTDGAMTQAAVTVALSDASVSEDKILNVLETLSSEEVIELLDL